MADQVPDSVSKCVYILKSASSDTEKFAALFMVTKLTKSESLNATSKKLLFEAIGFKFLKRLLLTSDVPVDCPPEIYKSIALSVLSSFCSEEELATHPEMLQNIPVFIEIVQQCDGDDFDDNLIIINEAYKCLQSIASYGAGQKALLDIGAVSKMSEIYSQQSFQTDEALTILVSLVTKFGLNAWNDNVKSFHSLMNKISCDFETDHSERKFELCDVLLHLLMGCPKESVALNASEEDWPASILKALNDILKSKIGKKQRDVALKLASIAVDILGIEWTLTDDENPKVFFLLLIQLCSIEVRMQLEGAAASLKKIMNEAELITSCFILLELAISYIASGNIDLEQKEKQQVYTALKGAFSQVILVLQLVSKSFAKDNNYLNVQEKVFVCAMVRVLSVWLAQETSAMRTAIYQLLPFMLTIANETFYAYRLRYFTEKVRKESKTPPSESEPDPDPLSSINVLRLFLPALCHLAVEEKSRQILLELKEDEILLECMSFHWSIVHYKKPPVPRSERLKVRTEPEPELPAKLLEDMKDSRAAMISICNIFMNITVLEQKVAEESPLFANILKFIFNNLPELKNIPENLVLHGNLAILGLLLLKQQATRVKKNDFSICRYIQSTIRFLWDAYNVDECNDGSVLVISITYKKYWIELMELWFLGMQTMSALLALIPWISEFAIESGWVEGIIDSLHKVKIGSLPSNTKSAYEDFLCHIVDANNSVTQLLKKHDALTVCRNHRFMELGKRLFEKFLIPVTSAKAITAKFLQNFRTCPHNPEYSIVEWRILLWTEALEGYSSIAEEVYRLWLQLRYENLSPTPEVVTLLKKLRKSYMLGLITNGTSNSQWEKVKRLNLGSYFDCILVSGDYPWEKPNQNIFLKACKILGVKPHNCVMVGDKLETDILGGKRASLAATVWISDSPYTSKSLPRPDYIVSSVTELSRFLSFKQAAPDFYDGNSNGSDGS